VPEAVLLGVGALAVAAGAVLQRITGIGFASVSAPALILLLGPVVGVEVVNALAALCSLVLLVSLWRHVDLRRTAMLTLAAAATTPLGVLLAVGLPPALLQVLMGVVMLAALFSVDLLARSRLVGGPLGGVVTGAVGGVANAAVGQAGPFMGAYAIASRWEVTGYVASMQLCWCLVNAVAVVLKGVPSIPPGTALVLGGALAAGCVASLVVVRFVTAAAARRCLFLVALAGGLVVLGKGVAGLLSS